MAFASTAANIRGIRLSPDRAVSSTARIAACHVRIPLRAQRPQALHLFRLQRRIDALDRHRMLLLHMKAVHPDHHRFLPIDCLLIFVSRILDLLLHIAAFDRIEHAAHGFDFFQIVDSPLSISLVSAST